MRSRSGWIVTACLSLVFAQACSPNAGEAPDTGAAAATAANATEGTAALADRTADAEAIRGMDQRWLRAVVGKNVDSIMTLYMPDAATLMPGQNPITTAEGRRAAYRDMVNMSLTDAQITTLGVEFSDDGTMAYDYGTYSATMTPPGAPAMKDRGTYLNVWRRTPSGWRMVAEMNNSSLPTPSSATPVQR